MVYRKRKGVRYDTWHWCKNCSNYPQSDYLTSDKKPSYGELCNECQSKEKNGNCQ